MATLLHTQGWDCMASCIGASGGCVGAIAYIVMPNV